jgi:hypothetical protein
VNKNRTHLLRSCAATALLSELSLDNSRARGSAANDEAVVAGFAADEHVALGEGDPRTRLLLNLRIALDKPWVVPLAEAGHQGGRGQGILDP